MPDPTRRLDQPQELDAPEALLAAALISSGSFDPGRLRVTVEDLGCWRKVWDFALAYQRTAKVAPPWPLVHSSFPDFRPIDTVDQVWAAQQIKAGAASRRLRAGITEALHVLNDADDTEAAYAHLAAIGKPELNPGSTQVSVFDDVVSSAWASVQRIPTPWTKLNEKTGGGIGQGELWYLMARPEQGKSINATRIAVGAAKLGYRVGYLSLEMPYRQVARRALRIMADGDRSLQARVESLDAATVGEAQRAMQANFDGELWFVDTNTNGGSMSINQVASYLPEVDLLVVDHIGLLTNPEGRSNTEELRVVGGVSNILRQYTITSDTAVLALSHVNRAGENDKSMAPPKLRDAAESDHIGRDGDVVISQKLISPHCMVAQTVKLREGEHVRWWHRFDVGHNKYDEMSREGAIDLRDKEMNDGAQTMGDDAF